jgi:hypothetical protein
LNFSECVEFYRNQKDLLQKSNIFRNLLCLKINYENRFLNIIDFLKTSIFSVLVEKSIDLEYNFSLTKEFRFSIKNDHSSFIFMKILNWGDIHLIFKLFKKVHILPIIISIQSKTVFLIKIACKKSNHKKRRNRKLV